MDLVLSFSGLGARFKDSKLKDSNFLTTCRLKDSKLEMTTDASGDRQAATGGQAAQIQHMSKGHVVGQRVGK